MSTQRQPTDQPVLNWHRDDIEQRCGFRGAAYTDTNAWLGFLLGLLLFILFYVGILAIRGSLLADIFLKRGPTQYPEVLFSCWSCAILFLKWRKLLFQERALELKILPDAHDFVLSSTTARIVLGNMCRRVDDPKSFALFNRIERALSNLSNIGVIADVSEMLRAQAENDEAAMESSYSLVRGFVWAIPVLGFIGTVWGLSVAITGFGTVLGTSNAIASLKDALRGVTAGLSTAFDTTLVALVAVLFIQLALTTLKRKEERFLDNCKDYCHANIISKLRLIQLREEEVGQKGG